MTRSFARIGRTLVVLSLCANIGFHFAALQSIAWAAMIINYSRKAPLAEAMAKTFDGKHPCELCKAITKSKNSEKKSEVQSPIQKFDLFCKTAGRLLFPPVPVSERTESVARHLARSDPPPVPPPRILLS